ncbi:SRPBCC domain-containing protein [Streptomyces sp. H51]|uniref:SRPBCC domain-containing protein n=1 Tax=Streptomyces sp. H51 TaxID=3111770 RepID=UPI002D78DA56|nr:SRPBCC domain-containing protein [Streptomyces sp. H51]
MEHEVFVPVPAQRLRDALADPAQVARAIPGLQQDAGSELVAGRLKVRVGSHSVTYRGSVRVTARDDGSYAAEGEATESRGTGTVRLALTLRVRDAGDGSALSFEGTAAADGRVTELPAESVAAAVTRLLNRFAENLAAAEEPRPSVFDVEVPPPSLAPDQDEDREEHEEDQGIEAESGAGDTDADRPLPAPGVSEVSDGFAEAAEPPAEPPAEAAHARRTMIGRSAEEVDHAPPRGRYAPVPAPQTVAEGSALRWAAPAAAVVLASAIVLGRALRRRH